MTNTKENKIVAEYYTHFKNSYKSFTQDLFICI
jgi:hypothetical protein